MLLLARSGDDCVFRGLFMRASTEAAERSNEHARYLFPPRVAQNNFLIFDSSMEASGQLSSSFSLCESLIPQNKISPCRSSNRLLMPQRFLNSLCSPLADSSGPRNNCARAKIVGGRRIQRYTCTSNKTSFHDCGKRDRGRCRSL